jgi:hypothetical protein
METPDSTTDSLADAQGEAETDEGQDLAMDDAADEAQSRLWIRALTPLLQLRKHDSDPSDRVQYAFDLMYIAACERVARILRSDLGA